MNIDQAPPVAAPIMTEGLRRACVEALLAGGSELSVEKPLRLFIALANAVTSGLQEGLEDPFIHEPLAMRYLEGRCEAIGARAAITALDWSRAHDEARIQARGRGPDSPEVFAATCIALERHVREEQHALRSSLIAIGMEEEPATGMARRTVLAGFAMATMGGDRDWARLLARGNTAASKGLDPARRDVARRLQADTMRRFMRITELDGSRDHRKDSGSSSDPGFTETPTQHEMKKVPSNPSIW